MFSKNYKFDIFIPASSTSKTPIFILTIPIAKKNLQEISIQTFLQETLQKFLYTKFLQFLPAEKFCGNFRQIYFLQKFT